MDTLSRIARALIESLLPLYRETDFAYAIAGAMGALALLLVAFAIIQHIMQTRAVTNATRNVASYIVFSKSSAASDADEAEAQFARRYQEIDKSMRSRGGLADAWTRYARTLSFLNAPPVRSSQRPTEFFMAAVPPPAWLGFAASLFVAFGLLATFLGLVAALTFATDGMSSTEPRIMQEALRDLLSAAASKFVTSVAGVGLSIILRLVERILSARLNRSVESLARAVEKGVRVDPDANGAALVDQMARLINRIDPPSPASPGFQHDSAIAPAETT